MDLSTQVEKFGTVVCVSGRVVAALVVKEGSELIIDVDVVIVALVTTPNLLNYSNY